jgi:hypothetical protein
MLALAITLAVLAIALVTLTVKQYTRSLLSTVRTSSLIEVRAAGLLPVVVGVRWDSLLLVVTYCRDSRRCSNVLLTLVLLLLLLMCHSCARSSHSC